MMADRPVDAYLFLPGGGEMGALVRSHDWAATSLGPITAWPQSLKTVVGTALLSPVPIVLLWGEDGVMIYNDAYSGFAGGRHPQLLGSKVREGWPEVADFNANVMKVGLRGETLSYRDQELTLFRPGRPEQAWMNLDYSPVLDENGEPAGVIAIVVETTERIVAERRLRESEALARLQGERVNLALDAGAIIGTWVWDLSNDRFTVDEAFARNFGLDPALGRGGLSLAQVVETVHPDDQEGLAVAINEAIERGGAFARQYRVRRLDGDYYWLEANGRVDRADDGTPLRFPGVLIDVEGRRAVEAERDRAISMLQAINETLEQRVEERTADLVKAEDALRQSQKMEAVGQLTGGLAHDFNNLLAGIMGSLELIQKRLAQGRISEVDRYMTVAQGATNRAAALTHRLLAFSRRQTLDPKPTNVNLLIAGIEELIRRTVGPTIAIEVKGPPDLWPALIDPPQLESAFLNLCINARDAMPDGGRITIETTNHTFDEREARERDVASGDYISLCVTDTGAGMSADIVAKAFDPFFTTKPIGQGTGLGLSMIYGFVRQSGGQIRIDSEVGSGTTICIYLPRHHGEADEPEAPAALGEPPRAEHPRTVLVVDDEPSVRMLVIETLEELGYVAIEAADSASGLKVLQSDVDLDLLVSDVGLPGGMNGRQMADAGRSVRPELKVLFITGYADAAVLDAADLDPGMQILTKPFCVDALAVRINALITSG